MQPRQATEIMAATLPSEIVFYRTPISGADIPNDHSAGSPDDIHTANQAMRMQPPAQASVVPIYGSVSTADIADAAKVALVTDEEGKRIVLGPEDITILQEEATEDGMEPGRIKALGAFVVDLRVKGGDPVRRTVNVKAQTDNQQQ